MIIHITNENFEQEVIKSDTPVLIDFWAPWCGPCRMMGPVFEELSKEMTNIKFVKIDTQENEALARQFQIQGIPTVSLMKGEQEIDRFSGFAPKPMLKQKIEAMLSKIKE